jgi:hypothetical protein
VEKEGELAWEMGWNGELCWELIGCCCWNGIKPPIQWNEYVHGIED